MSCYVPNCKVFQKIHSEYLKSFKDQDNIEKNSWAVMLHAEKVSKDIVENVCKGRICRQCENDS